MTPMDVRLCARLLVLAALGLAASALRADPPVPLREESPASTSAAAKSPDKSLADILRALREKHKLLDAAVGVHAASLADQRERVASDARVPLGVASNAKLITSAAALHWLGPDYVWRTSVHLVGGEKQGERYTGNLLVIGRGDPNLSGRFHEGNPTAIFEKWAEAIQAAGVRQVAGELLVDDLFFDRTFVHPAWPADQLAFWYCAPVSALALNDNCIDVTVSPGDKAGAPAVVALSPKTRFTTIVNQCKTVTTKKQHRISLLRTPGKNEIVVKGGYLLKGGGYTESITVQDPVRYFGTVLKETLARKGVAVAGGVRVLDAAIAPAPAEASAVAFHESRMPATLEVTNRRSQNFYAEQILKTMGAVKYGRGTFDSGRTCAKLFLDTLGVPEAEVTLSDGCGLSPQNRFSPWALTRVLLHATKQPWAKMYADSLAVAGENGTLEKRLREEGVKGRVKGKTGYIGGVSALSGYVETKHNGTWAFSILVNGFRSLAAARSFQDDLVKAWIEHPLEPQPR